MEKAMAPHSSTLAWKIPWTEEPGRLQSMRSLRVRHDWVTSLSLFTFMHWRKKWQPTPPGESQGRGEPGGLPSMELHRVRHDWSNLAAAAAHGYLGELPFYDRPFSQLHLFTTHSGLHAFAQVLSSAWNVIFSYIPKYLLLFSCSVISVSLQHHGLQHTRLPCPSPSPGACSNSCPLGQWCHPAISSCHPLLLLPSIFLSVRVFSNELALHIWWPKYCLIFKAQRMFPCPRKNQVLLLILLSQFLLHFAWRYS